MKLKASMALLIASCAAGAAHAEDSFPPVTVSGFGTLALTRTNTDDAEFSRVNQARGANTNATTGVDSSLGLQAFSKLNDRLSLTAQGLVRKAASDAYGAELTLAFAKVKVTDEVSVRIGRIAPPVYSISEYRNVGYAITMIRPPVEMYYQVPLNFIDGADVIYRTSVGDTSITAQAAIGKSEVDNPFNGQFHSRGVKSFNVVAENGPFTLRLQRLSASVSSDSPFLAGLNSGLSAFGYPAQGGQLLMKDRLTSFTSIGAGVDWKNIVAQAEYGKVASESAIITDSAAWYTMFGYRIGSVLPYVNYSKSYQLSPRTLAGLPAGGPPPLQQLVGIANYLVKAPVQTSTSIGVRWDFHRSAAFKLQVDRVSPQDGEGNFINAKPNFKGPVTVVAGGIDFVF